MIKRIAGAFRALFSEPSPVKPIPNIQEPARPAPGVWTTRALDTLHQWEMAIATLELMGAMGEKEAWRQVEYIDRLRKDLLFDRPPISHEQMAGLNMLDAQKDFAAFWCGQQNWKPGAEHQQPHPVKENEDGTLYYRHAVYRKIGDHGGRKNGRKCGTPGQRVYGIAK